MKNIIVISKSLFLIPVEKGLTTNWNVKSGSLFYKIA